MSRIDELQKRFPSIPRQFIIRWDAKVHGLKDNGSLDELGQWVRMAGGAGSYTTYDHDITIKEWLGAKAGRQKPGYILRPGKFVLRNGLDLGGTVNTKSDLEIRSDGDGKFALYQGDDRVEAVYHMPRKAAKEEPAISTGAPATNFVNWTSKYCFFIAPVRHCEYFPLGVACKFCNFNATQEDARATGLQRPTTIQVEETLEAYKMHASEVRVVEGRVELGGFTNHDVEARLHATFVEKIASATPHKPNLKIWTQPLDRKHMLRLRDVGLDNIGIPMEIWDPELFPEAVPGKSQYVGRERYLEAFQEAVDILGAGNVQCVFVGGLSRIPEKGHGTWQEARDSMIEGNTWMVSHGIAPIITPLRLPPGSTYGNDENRKKCPPTDYYLEVALAQHAAMKEYGYYDKVNKLMVCPIDCITGNICVELGVYELAGSLANWSVGVIPREANWYLDWEETFASLVKTQ